MTRIDADVLLVGGGPAGAATAALLARRGRDVLLLEKAAFPREKPCAEYLSPGVIDVLERLGALDAVRRADTAWPLGMRIRTARRDFVLSYTELPDVADDPRTHPRRRTALGIARPAFDRVLMEHARDAGARVRERIRVVGAVTEGGRVIGVRALGPEGVEHLHARFVVAADGLHSAIAHSLGLRVSARWPRRLGLVARYSSATEFGPFGEMHVGPGLYCGLAPVGKGLVNVGLVGEMSAMAPGESAVDFFERRLAALPSVTRTLGDARRITPVRGVGPLAVRLRRVSGPGFLLVGDAAGFLDPFTGEGIFRALRGAELAAEAAEHALRRADAVPSGYENARHAAFAGKERVCLLVQLFLSSHRLFDYVAGRLAARPHLADRLAGVLGDYQPAGPALRPGFLWSLLRP